MKLSKYNKFVKHNNNDYLLFNSISGSLIKVSNQIKKDIETKNLSEDNFKKLKELGFFKKEEGDERATLRKKYEAKTLNHLNKYMFITVTDRCNLGCHYCFEEKNQWINMSDETVDALIEFSKKFLSATKTDSFGIGWYGGEPTINMKAIKKLSSFYKDFCEKNDIHFSQMIISNGTTFNESVCETLINLGIKKAQITVDGIKEDHDKSRPYLKDLTLDQMSPAQRSQAQKLNPSLSLNVINNEKPKENLITKSCFDEIIKGIEKYVQKGGEVSLRMNVNSKTIEKTTQLLDDLHKRKLFYRNENGGFLYAYAQPIYDIGSCGNNNYESSGCGSCPSKTTTEDPVTVNSMKVSEFAEKVHIIKDWYKSKGIKWFDHSNEMHFTGDTCTANKKYEYVVNPDGTLTKCTHDVGKPEKVIGSVFDDNVNPDDMNIPNTSYDRFNPFDDKECFGCEVLPICMGGCKSNNNAGEAKEYEAGCSTIKYSYEEDIIRLYESSKS